MPPLFSPISSLPLSTASLCHPSVQPNEIAIPGCAFVIKKKERRKEKNQSFGLFGPSWSSARDARSQAVLKTLQTAVAQTGRGKWLPGNHYGRLTCAAGCLVRGCCRLGDHRGHEGSRLGAAFPDQSSHSEATLLGIPIWGACRPLCVLVSTRI